MTHLALATNAPPFRGVLIFATNLVKNYDPAFETRVRNVHFPLPDRDRRRRIWAGHLPP